MCRFTCLKDCGAAVLQQVPPVRDMDGIGRAAPTAVGIGRAPITGDDFNAGVGLQPGCKAVRLAVGQQVDNGMTLEIDEDRAVALSTLPGLVVHPEHTPRRAGRRRRATTDKA